ncbi:hypothetical protein AWC21_00475 [Mycolicibacterium peregrinum]|nr:hypothetical protein AWC21_00475 [Mycolicibacterium peregrinum]
MLAVLSAVAAVMFLASCDGTTPDEKPQPTSETAAINGEPAGSNAGDSSFAVSMIANHAQAVQVAELVPDRTTNSDLVELAADIVSSRRTEIEFMKALLVQWNADATTSSMPDQPPASAQGSIDEQTVSHLQALSSQDFDILWLQTLIPHAQGAIQIANAEIADGENVDALGLAKQIVAKQQAEIDRMQQLLASGG